MRKEKKRSFLLNLVQAGGRKCLISFVQLSKTIRYFRPVGKRCNSGEAVLFVVCNAMCTRLRGSDGAYYHLGKGRQSDLNLKLSTPFHIFSSGGKTHTQTDFLPLSLSLPLSLPLSLSLPPYIYIYY